MENRLFLAVYASISLEAAHKTIVALLGASIFLIVSMMVIVNIARHTGMFQWVAIRTAKLARGEPALILVLLSVVTMTPMIKDIGSSLGATAVLPLWWALSLGACLGGNGTLVGASANVITAGLAAKSGYKITFLEFTKYGALFTVMTLLVSTGYLWLRNFPRG
jgi:Na+/H+ antiporter NhaD/arsenite permease-like protein